MSQEMEIHVENQCLRHKNVRTFSKFDNENLKLFFNLENIMEPSSFQGI